MSEYIQFVAAMILMVAILIGSYWFVLAPSRAEKRLESEREREAN